MIYKGITSLRNYLFDHNILSQFSPEKFSIGIGNLSMGGTGKTPMVNFLISCFDDKKVGVISRGYGRKTNGFIHLNQNHTAQEVGDEPFMLFRNNPKIEFFVSEKRVEGYQKAKELFPNIDLFLFDDVFQHRYIKPHLNLLLTDFHAPFYKDKVLPFGRLREARSGAKRANAVIVTKVPSDIENKEEIIKQIRKYTQPDTPVFFAEYNPMPPINNNGDVLNRDEKVVLISALGNNALFYSQQAENYAIVEHFALRDHSSLSRSQLDKIFSKYLDRPIITTEKDWVKILPLLNSTESAYFFIPKIKVQIDPLFINYIMDFSKNRLE